MKAILFKWTARLSAVLLVAVTVLAGMPVSAADDGGETRLACSTLAALDILDEALDETAFVTRAEFARLLIAMTDREDEVAAAEQRTIFTDVTSARADAGYINLAYTAGYLSGLGNGNFNPDGYIAYEAAVTACLRILGYSESEIGASYPDDALRLGKKLGLTDSLDRLVGEALNRGETARLLYATLCAETTRGAIYAEQMVDKVVRDVVLLSADCVSPDGILLAAKLYSAGSAVWYPRAAELDAAAVGAAGAALLDADGRIVAFLPDETRYTVVDGILLANATRQNGKYTVELYTETGRVSYPRANTISANLVGATGTLLLRENGYATAFIADEDAVYDLVKNVTLLAAPVTGDTGIPNCVEVYASGKTAYYPLADDVSLDSRQGSVGTLLCDENGDVLDFLPDDEKTTVEHGIFLGSTSAGATFYLNSKSVTYPAAAAIAASNAGYSGRILRNERGYVTAFIADTSVKRTVIEDAVLLSAYTAANGSYGARFYVDGKTTVYPYPAGTISTPSYSYPWYYGVDPSLSSIYSYLYGYGYGYTSSSATPLSGSVGCAGTLILDGDGCIEEFIPGDTDYRLISGVLVGSTSSYFGSYVSIYAGGMTMQYLTSGSINAQSGASGILLVDGSGRAIAFVSDSGSSYSMSQSGILLSTDTIAADGSTRLAEFYAGGRVTTYAVSGSLSSAYIGQSGKLMLNSSGAIVGFIPEQGNTRSTTVTSAAADTLETPSGSYRIDASRTVIVNGRVSTWGAVASTLAAGTAITLHFDSLGGIDLLVVG